MWWISILLGFIGTGAAEGRLPIGLARDPVKHPPHMSTFAASRSGGQQTDWDVAHYDINVVLDSDASQVQGVITVSADASVDQPDALMLHANGPDIESITVDGDDADWSQSGEEVLVSVEDTSAGDTVLVEVTYTAGGNDSFDYGLNWGDPIFSFHEPDGARKWLVVFDDPADKATLRWTITADVERVVVANGVLMSKEEGDEVATWVFEFDAPIATYLMVLHAGSYEESVDASGPVPVYTYAKDGSIDQATEDFASTGEMIDVFSELWVEYPWTHYANAVAPFGGAMEHTTATTFGNSIIGTEWAEWVNVHELGHHWWGDMVTLSTWEEIWLNEGFASYTETLWAEIAYGESMAQDYRVSQVESYFAWKEWEGEFAVYDPEYMWGGTVYDKGAMVLHMLRVVVGDTAFFQGMVSYGEKYAFGSASIDDFREEMEAAYGGDLVWFFDQWIYRGGDPSYVVGVTQTEMKDGTWQVDFHVAQDTDETWTMPLPVLLTLDNGDAVESEIWADGAESVVSMCLEQSVNELEVDPNDDLIIVAWEQDDSRFSAADSSCDGEELGDTGQPEDTADPFTDSESDSGMDGDTPDASGSDTALRAGSNCGCVATASHLPRFWVLLGAGLVVGMRRSTVARSR